MKVWTIIRINKSRQLAYCDMTTADDISTCSVW